MAIAFRTTNGFTTAGDSSGGNLTINKPSAVSDGDVLVVCLYSELSSTAWTLPAGWNWWGGSTGQKGATHNNWTFTAYKLASSEGSSYVFTHAGTAWRSGCIAAFTGAYIGGDPEDSTGPTGSNSGDNNPQMASITTSSDNDMLIGCSANYAGTTFAVGGSGMALCGQIGGTGIVYLIKASAGASGTKTCANSCSGEWATWHQAIKEASGVTTLSISATDTFTNTQALD